jgi:hypothetical protein
MSESAGIEVDLELRLAAAIGQQVADALSAVDSRKKHRPRYPQGVIFPDYNSVVLTTGTASPNWIGPLMGWAWRVFRIQIAGAVAGTYSVYRDIGQGPQDLLTPTAAGGFAPNGVYEPHELFLRYPKKINAVATGVTTAGLLVVDFINIREDYLADYAA